MFIPCLGSSLLIYVRLAHYGSDFDVDLILQSIKVVFGSFSTSTNVRNVIKVHASVVKENSAIKIRSRK